ncbi:uroporphyrin-III C-methyltransferase HemX [Psychromonas sp. CNPT3]|uniref:uroporphyrinogen-III C-methyltransferase n=1 Tax=Psychromonas sp. CNPT3 TaxID=314282 RepID=UPI00006E7059|nr:uroporphyrinogen-III C-methyltransferase [Psychromonas sp. CNPT3]AGH80063.1 uroporphyrin-III C-methyltransferase HemX [Psychromonas sp. CNPT3]
MPEHKDNEKISIKAASVSAKTPEKKRSPKSGYIALYLSIFALLLLMVMGGSAFTYYQSAQKQVKQQQEKLLILSTKLLRQEQSQINNQRLLTLLQSNLKQDEAKSGAELQKMFGQNKLLHTDLQALQRHVSEATIRQPNDWILAEVEYLLSLAGRKIWLEHDVQTAMALLGAADQRIVELNDASLSPLRGALLEDIEQLRALPKKDFEGMVLALTSLERRVDKLKLIDLEVQAQPKNKSRFVSADISDWEDNISKSWNNFLANFITITKRDSKIEALLSPTQTWYLKENIRNNLAKAEFAVYRQQQVIYDIAMHNISRTLATYFKLDDSTTSHFNDAIIKLSKNKLQVNYPDQLQSTAILQTVLMQRIKRSLSSPRVTTGG